MTRLTCDRPLWLRCCAAWLRRALRRRTIPNRPVRVIASSSAGGISDIFIRVSARSLHKQWGQPLVIENRPGGAFNIGTRACAEAAPDGYTICILPPTRMTYNQLPVQEPDVRSCDKDFEPITQLFYLNQVLVVTSDLNVKTVDELAALSKAKPGTLSYSAPAAPHRALHRSLKQRDTAPTSCACRSAAAARRSTAC